MNTDDPLQQNIRRTTAIHALKQVRAAVDEANADDAYKARALRWVLGFVLLILLFVVVLLVK